MFMKCNVYKCVFVFIYFWLYSITKATIRMKTIVPIVGVIIEILSGVVLFINCYTL